MAAKDSTKSGKRKSRPRKGSGKAKAEPANRRERILEAATEEFAEKGLAGARVDEIAKRSECNKQLIYYYFESKQGLNDAVLRRLIELTHREQEKREERGEQLIPWISDDGVSEYTPLWRRFWMWEALETDPRRIPLEKERRAVFRRLGKLVSKDQDRGEIAADLDPEMFALAFSAIREYPHIFPQLTKFFTGESPDAPKFKKRQRAFLDQLRARLRSE
jgi:AcrR family transcriptional regulator